MLWSKTPTSSLVVRALPAGDNVFVTTDHMGEPMPLNTVVQGLQVTLTEYNVKIHEQSKVLVPFG